MNTVSLKRRKCMFQEKIITSKNGQEILLRPPGRNDLNELLRYANKLSAEDTYLTLSKEVITREEEVEYLENMLKEIDAGIQIHIFAFSRNQMIANAEVRRVTKSRSRQKHVGIVSISVDRDWRGLGIGKEILRTLIKESKQLKLRLLQLTAFSNNLKALALYKSMGFKVAGEIPGSIWYKGDYVDEVSMYLPLV